MVMRGAEIDLADQRITGEFLRCPLMGDAAFGEDHGAAGNRECCLHILLHQHHGDAAGIDPFSISKTSLTIFGERPAEGSSRMITGGSSASARATASICRWPPESAPARRDGRAANSGSG